MPKKRIRVKVRVKVGLGVEIEGFSHKSLRAKSFGVTFSA